jgi:hypothetical protein
MRMSKVTCDMAMSIDGFVAGLNQSLAEPFGDGVGDRLHRWMFDGVGELRLEKLDVSDTDLVTHLSYRVVR